MLEIRTAQIVIASESKSEKECPESAIKAEDCEIIPIKPFAIARARFVTKPSHVIFKARLPARSFFCIFKSSL